jgi:predicted metal-binding membrane protein
MLPLATSIQSAGLTPAVAATVVLACVALWQCSPAKQICLNHCHVRPALGAFGWRADVDVMTFGTTHAIWCIGSCGALMLVPLILPGGHAPAMTAAAVVIFCERLDRPAFPVWRWRGFGTAWRVVAGQLRLRAAARV